MGQLAEADAAQAELAEHRTGPAAAAAAGVAADLELRLAAALLISDFLAISTSLLLLAAADGDRGCDGAASVRARWGRRPALEREPERVEQGLAAASSVAVVTMVMSMPRGASILS